MPTPEELLRQQRTATRIDPTTGARSSVYGGPGQVPKGVVTSGVEPMAARAQTIQPPASQYNSARRAMFDARPAVDPTVQQRAMAQGPTAPSNAPRSIAQMRGMPTPATPAAPGVKAGRFAMPDMIQRAAGNAGQALRGAVGTAGRIAGGIAGMMQVSKGVNQMAGDQPGSFVEGAGRTAAGAAALAPRTVLPKVMGVAGPVGAVASGSLALTDMLGMPATGLSPHALGTRAVNAALGNETIRGGIDALRRAMGFPEAAAAAPAGTPAPAAGTPQAPGAAAAPATPAAAWFDTPAAAAANVAQPPAAPRAARGGGPISRAAAPAAQRVAQLQDMAARELAAPQTAGRAPIAEVNVEDSAPIQVFGPGGQQGRQVGPGMTELPAWEGDALRGAPPDGQVQIDRGGGRSMISSYANAQQGGAERAAGIPETAGLSLQELAQVWNATAGSDDPRLQALNQQTAELIATQMREAGALERTQMSAESGLAQQREATRGTLGAANIRAQADKASRGGAPATVQIDVPVIDPATGQPAVDRITGQPVTRRSAAYWDPAANQYRPVEIGEAGGQAQSAQWNAAIEALVGRGYTPEQAADYLRSKTAAR